MIELFLLKSFKVNVWKIWTEKWTVNYISTEEWTVNYISMDDSEKLYFNRGVNG